MVRSAGSPSYLMPAGRLEHAHGPWSSPHRPGPARQISNGIYSLAHPDGPGGILTPTARPASPGGSQRRALAPGRDLSQDLSRDLPGRDLPGRDRDRRRRDLARCPGRFRSFPDGRPGPPRSPASHGPDAQFVLVERQPTSDFVEKTTRMGPIALAVFRPAADAYDETHPKQDNALAKL